MRPQVHSPKQVTLDAALAAEIVNSLPLPVVTFGDNLEILYRSPAAKEGLPVADNLGQLLADCTIEKEPADWPVLLETALARPQFTAFDGVRCRANERTRVFRIVCTPIKSAAAAGVLVFQDLTATVAMESQLAAAERLAAVGKLAARVAHELNNPLDGILRYLNLAARIAQENGLEQVERYLKHSRGGLQRMAQIVSELLEFSRSSYTAAADVNINKALDEALSNLETLAHDKQVAIRRDYAPEMPNVRGGNLFQVFCNLIKNAIDAMAEHCPKAQKRSLTVRTFCNDDDAVIEFIDSGPGLSDEVREKIFEPFFTTKAAGKGTGLGLAICRDIIERYHGRLTADNHAEGGARFVVSIPLEVTSYRR